MRAYTDMDTLATLLSQLFEKAVDPDEVPTRLAGLALAAESLRARRLLEEKHTPQQIEFERDYWQRKVGALLSLIERDAPDLHERACVLVNTDRSGYLNAAEAQTAFANVFAVPEATSKCGDRARLPDGSVVEPEPQLVVDAWHLLDDRWLLCGLSRGGAQTINVHADPDTQWEDEMCPRCVHRYKERHEQVP